MSMGQNLKNVKVKIIIAGEPGSGKSYIAQAVDACIPARRIGVSIGKVSEPLQNTSVEMTLLTWTITWGRPMEKTHLKQAEAAIIVCNLERPETVKKTPLWAERIQEIAGGIPLYFAAINTNLETWEEFEWLKEKAGKYDSTCFPIDMHDLHSARKLFKTIAQHLAEDFLERKKVDQEQLKVF
jgi:hypothetical protein